MKTALVRDKVPSYWKSCQVITQNLQKKYPEAQVFYDGLNDESYETFKLAKNLVDLGPERIVFVDHKHPKVLLHFLNDLNLPHSTEIIFHLVGNFFEFRASWLKCEEVLKKYKVKFVTGSDSYAQFVSKFLNNSENCLDIQRFEPCWETFFFDKKNRASLRLKYSIEDADLVIIYSGRLTAQKNIDELLALFKKFGEVTGTSPHLFLAGEFDDIGFPLFGISEVDGSYYRRIKRMLDEKTAKRVHFLGELKREELNEYLNASDLFVSLSTHHDEDFGMSAHEALACGLPLLLSHWGGHKDLAHLESVETVPVNWDDQYLVIDKIVGIKKLMKLASLDKTSIANFEKSLFYKMANIDTVVKFEGFSHLFKEIAAEKISEENREFFIREKYPKYYGDFYAK